MPLEVVEMKDGVFVSKAIFLHQLGNHLNDFLGTLFMYCGCFF